MKTNNHVILLVEDESNDVILIKRAFQKSNVVNHIQVAKDGEEALDYLKGIGEYQDRSKYPLPMLILLDLKLPRKSGFEVLEWLRQQPKLKRIPVVILTSSKESTDINKAYDLGANTYLVKPVSFDALVDLTKNIHFCWLIISEHPEVNEK